jgi:hypothetical protein
MLNPHAIYLNVSVKVQVKCDIEKKATGGLD